MRSIAWEPAQGCVGTGDLYPPHYELWIIDKIRQLGGLEGEERRSAWIWNSEDCYVSVTFFKFFYLSSVVLVHVELMPCETEIWQKFTETSLFPLPDLSLVLLQHVSHHPKVQHWVQRWDLPAWPNVPAVPACLWLPCVLKSRATFALLWHWKCQAPAMDVAMCHCSRDWGNLGCRRPAQTRQGTNILPFLSRASPLLARWKPFQAPAGICLVQNAAGAAGHFTSMHQSQEEGGGAWNTRVLWGRDTGGALSFPQGRWVTAVLCRIAQEESQLLSCC